MEWAIPIQTFTPNHVRLGSFHPTVKHIIPLSYQEGPYTFTSLNILLPTVHVKSYEPATGRLVLSLQANHSTQQKLQQFQELLITSVTRNQKQWFPGEAEKGAREIRDGFQPFLDGNALHLYCPIHSAAHNEIQYYSGGVGWTRGTPPPGLGGFAVGAPIRLALRIYGISFHQHPLTKAWTGRFRLQHRIVAMYSD
jgi:hypothetical protein